MDQINQLINHMTGTRPILVANSWPVIEVLEKWVVAASWLRTSFCNKWRSSNLLILLLSIDACTRGYATTTNWLIDQMIISCCQQRALVVGLDAGKQPALALHDLCTPWRAFTLVHITPMVSPVGLWMWINPHGQSSAMTGMFNQLIEWSSCFVLLCRASTVLHIAPSQKIIFSNCCQKTLLACYKLF